MTDEVTEVISGARPWGVVRSDCLDFLAALPEGAADLVFCSPPYEQARLYLEGGENLGIARDTEEWVAWMVQVCHAARRACKGLCAFVVEGQTEDFAYSGGPVLLWADLIRGGFATRKSPLYVRDGIMGSGGPDWLRNRYEFILCLTRGGRLPWSDNKACGHPPKCGAGGALSYRTLDGSRVNKPKTYSAGVEHAPDGSITRRPNRAPVPDIANPGNLIDCGPSGGGHLGSMLAHQNEAPFPEKLAEFFVRSFCPPGGLVIDPFSGSGTTGAVSVRLRRQFLGCDLRESQVALSRKRIGLETPLLCGYGEDNAPQQNTEAQ